MTVETILNLVWLVVAVAAVWLWRFRWRVARRKADDRPWLEATAMVCILALLFPVISLTDDLHPEVIPVEASSSKRALCLLSAHGYRAASAGMPAHHHSPVFVCLRRPQTSGEPQYQQRSSRPPVPNPLCLSAVSSGRAPPSLA